MGAQNASCLVGTGLLIFLLPRTWLPKQFGADKARSLSLGSAIGFALLLPCPVLPLGALPLRPSGVKIGGCLKRSCSFIHQRKRKSRYSDAVLPNLIVIPLPPPPPPQPPPPSPWPSFLPSSFSPLFSLENSKSVAPEPPSVRPTDRPTAAAADTDTDDGRRRGVGGRRD